MLRAVPATMLTGRFDIRSIQVGHFDGGDASSCSRVFFRPWFCWVRPNRFQFRWLFLISTAAGGVLVMKEKVRSAYTVMTTV
jgi:hypothetical protein